LTLAVVLGSLAPVERFSAHHNTYGVLLEAIANIKLQSIIQINRKLEQS